MTRLLLILLLLALPLRAAINESVMLDAIADVETGNRDLVGKAGERGAHQLLPSVARRVGGHDRAAARRWLRIVIADMERAGIYVCPINAACVWNSGLNTVRRGRTPMSSWAYAVRVNNIYDSRLTRESNGAYSAP